MLRTVDIDLIEPGTRLRDISEAQVASLINSIADVGLLHPIAVYERRIIRDGISVDGYGLVAGLHRLTACKRLGLVEIDVAVVVLSELQRQIAECDENLCGSQLTPSDRVRFTKRRKDAYEALHPETKHGANQHTRGDANLATPSFAADQSRATGASERAVARDAERGEKVDDRALDLLKHTKLDTGTYLDTLKALPKADQVKQVRRDLAKPKPKLTKSQITAAQVKALVDAWNKAGVPARTEFLTHLGVTINTPAHTSGGPAKDTEPVVSDAENSPETANEAAGTRPIPSVRVEAPPAPVQGPPEQQRDTLGVTAGETAPSPEPEFEAVIDTAHFPDAVKDNGAQTLFKTSIQATMDAELAKRAKKQWRYSDPAHRDCLDPGQCGGLSNLVLCQRCNDAAGVAA